MGIVLEVGTEVEIADAMNRSYIGKRAVITKIVSTNPICYELSIGGGHWANSCIKKVTY